MLFVTLLLVLASSVGLGGNEQFIRVLRLHEKILAAQLGVVEKEELTSLLQECHLQMVQATSEPFDEVLSFPKPTSLGLLLIWSNEELVVKKVVATATQVVQDNVRAGDVITRINGWANAAAGPRGGLFKEALAAIRASKTGSDIRIQIKRRRPARLLALVEELTEQHYSDSSLLTSRVVLPHDEFMRVNHSFGGSHNFRDENGLLVKGGLDSVLKRWLGFPFGFYIEAGGNNGLMQSNSLLFDRFFGWNGLLIEPSPSAYAQCKANRPNAIVENFALVSSTSMYKC